MVIHFGKVKQFSVFEPFQLQNFQNSSIEFVDRMNDPISFGSQKLSKSNWFMVDLLDWKMEKKRNKIYEDESSLVHSGDPMAKIYGPQKLVAPKLMIYTPQKAYKKWPPITSITCRPWDCSKLCRIAGAVPDIADWHSQHWDCLAVHNRTNNMQIDAGQVT